MMEFNGKKYVHLVWGVFMADWPKPPTRDLFGVFARQDKAVAKAEQLKIFIGDKPGELIEIHVEPEEFFE